MAVPSLFDIKALAVTTRAISRTLEAPTPERQVGRLLLEGVPFLKPTAAREIEVKTAPSTVKTLIQQHLTEAKQHQREQQLIALAKPTAYERIGKPAFEDLTTTYREKEAEQFTQQQFYTVLEREALVEKHYYHEATQPTIALPDITFPSITFPEFPKMPDVFGGLKDIGKYAVIGVVAIGGLLVLSKLLGRKK